MAVYNPWSEFSRLSLNELEIVVQKVAPFWAALTCRLFRDAVAVVFSRGVSTTPADVTSSDTRLRLARSLGCPFTDAVLAVGAAGSGCVEVLAQFEPNQCDAVCAAAASAGHWTVLAWAVERGWGVNAAILAHADWYGQADVVADIVARGVPLPKPFDLSRPRLCAATTGTEAFATLCDWNVDVSVQAEHRLTAADVAGGACSFGLTREYDVTSDFELVGATGRLRVAIGRLPAEDVTERTVVPQIGMQFVRVTVTVVLDGPAPAEFGVRTRQWCLLSDRRNNLTQTTGRLGRLVFANGLAYRIGPNPVLSYPKAVLASGRPYAGDDLERIVVA